MTDTVPPQETPSSGLLQPRFVRLLFGSKKEWDFAPFGDFWVMTVSPVTAPNIIRRVMQRIFIGSRYRLIEDRPLTPIIIRSPNDLAQMRRAETQPRTGQKSTLKIV